MTVNGIGNGKRRWTKACLQEGKKRKRLRIKPSQLEIITLKTTGRKVKRTILGLDVYDDNSCAICVNVIEKIITIPEMDYFNLGKKLKEEYEKKGFGDYELKLFSK